MELFYIPYTMVRLPDLAMRLTRAHVREYTRGTGQTGGLKPAAVLWQRGTGSPTDGQGNGYEELAISSLDLASLY